MKLLQLSTLALLLIACRGGESTPGENRAQPSVADKPSVVMELTPEEIGVFEVATLAGGCFWCMEAPFEVLPGVHSVISGYSGGAEQDPTYKQVSRGSTGHTEAIQVTFEPSVIDYGTVLEVFWRQFDPTDAGGSFVDRGSQYRPEIFFHDERQERIARESRAALEASGRFDKPIATPVTAFSGFFEAEDYHQDFYKKSPDRYYSYRKGSGRDRFLDRVWGAEREVVIPAAESEPVEGGFVKPPAAELRQRLTSLQYKVTQEDGTERAFKNEFWDNKRPGIYVDVVSGEPLFSSAHKYESGTGWPSFDRPLVDENIVMGSDRKLGYSRDEVRSRLADSHLGHRFDDGPEPTGLRYCINSAALRFIPLEDLEREGYGQYAVGLK